MFKKIKNKGPAISIALKAFGTIVFILFLAIGVNAQNTKGDKPIPNQRQVRESKFKSVKKKKNIKTRDISGRRLRTRNQSSASRANASWPQPNPYANRKQTKTERAAKPRGRVFDTPPSDRQQPWRGDISGRKIRVQSQKSQSARTNVYPQRGPYVNNPSKKPPSKPTIYKRTASGSRPIRQSPRQDQRAWKGDIKGGPVGTPSRSGKHKKIFSQKGPFVNHYSKKANEPQRTYPNQSKIRRAARQAPGKPSRFGSAYPRSATGNFITRGRKNVYWGKFSKGEKPFTRDITGRPLRLLNFRSAPAGLISRDTVKFFGRRPGGDRPFKGGYGGFRSATKRGQQAWQGDISGRKIRAYTTGRKGETAGQLIFPRKLSISGAQGGVGKPQRGSGYRSRSGKSRIYGDPLPPRAPGIGANGINYQGRLRRGQMSPGFSRQGVGFAGSLKSRRPDKGGGSVSGKLWNNGQSPIPVRTPRGGAEIGAFQGTFKRGELSRGFSRQGADYTGSLKTKRPLKGGGSISGKLWNNKENPIGAKVPPSGAEKINGFPGHYKLFDLAPSMVSQGEGFSGNIKTRRPKKGGGSVSGKLWNNKEQPIEVRTPPSEGQAVGYAGKIKLPKWKRSYIQNPNAADESIKKQRPDKTTYEVAGLHVKVRQGQYKDKPLAAKGAMPGVAPSKSSVKASEYARGVKMYWQYKHNPNSASEALKVRAPDKAYAKIGSYQGNIKMRKYNDQHLHPDAQFAHGFRDNVKDERTIFMNFKLFWAKLFKKSDTQPDHLKDKLRKPRYDKGEQGMWYQ